jgi:hypothetical protein
MAPTKRNLQLFEFPLVVYFGLFCSTTCPISCRSFNLFTLELPAHCSLSFTAMVFFSIAAVSLVFLIPRALSLTVNTP